MTEKRKFSSFYELPVNTTQNLDEISPKKTCSSLCKLPTKTRNAAIKCMDLNSPIFEIVEEILLHLRVRDLITVQRVCRAWNEIIANSSPLQAKIFFKPDYSKELKQSSEWELNPVISEILDIRFDALEHKTLCHPISFQKNRAQHLDKECYAREEASWKRMLVFQPPLKVIHTLSLTWRQDPGPLFGIKRSRNHPFRFPNGMRAGELPKILPRHPACCVSLFRPYFPAKVTSDDNQRMRDDDQVPRVYLKLKDHPGRMPKSHLTIVTVEKAIWDQGIDIPGSNSDVMSISRESTERYTAAYYSGGVKAIVCTKLKKEACEDKVLEDNMASY